ncbi:hypothetical protein DWB77_07158 [Streptomyces hundungensis]|uniref:Condensation domain-containing protein n=1 Tax=Streptomyces hundungensis TaxID=1077946 RepID=A0A387HQF7_9ACTN|nr:hypothetical protein [Streptomyces hundungensis]AYG84943.1 hypothetical protein DWB77_07158 [Streptomyces hundungensis]
MTAGTRSKAARPGLRPAAVAVRDIYSFLADLGLDCDVNPCTAFVGTVEPGRIEDPAAWREFVGRLGLTRALADLVDVAEQDVVVTLAPQPGPVEDSPDTLADLVTAYHNAHPLRLDEVVHLACWPLANGECVVFVKFSHLVVDLTDVVDLLRHIRAHLRGEEAAGRIGARYRHHERTVERYAALPAADPAEVTRMLGELPTPGRKGVPTISASEQQWLPLREGVTFDELLSAVTAALLPALDGGLVLQYPFSRWEFATRGGYYVEIKPLVVRAGGAARYTPEYFAETREAQESLGRFTMSDLDAFARAFTRGRMPRVVVSDTTFMRPEPDLWRWVPIRSGRVFEDLKFLADRSWPGPPLLRMQYKRGFLTPETAADVLDRLKQRIGASGGTLGPVD